MNAAYDDLNQVPASHMLACGAKLVAMLIQSIEDDDPFACLLSIQGSIEVFAAQAATPIEKALAQSMRQMAEEMMRRNPNPHHLHGKTARRFIEQTQRPRLRFQRARKS
jgi:hypothetical protein